MSTKSPSLKVKWRLLNSVFSLYVGIPVNVHEDLQWKKASIFSILTLGARGFLCIFLSSRNKRVPMYIPWSYPLCDVKDVSLWSTEEESSRVRYDQKLLNKNNSWQTKFMVLIIFANLERQCNIPSYIYCIPLPFL